MKQPQITPRQNGRFAPSRPQMTEAERIAKRLAEADEIIAARQAARDRQDAERARLYGKEVK